MSVWTSHELAAAAEGRWLNTPPHAPIIGVGTDTRDIQPGMLFVALKGENFDGHNFIQAAADQGAAAALVQSEIPNLKSAIPLLLVPDTLAALQNLARFHRTRLRDAGVKVIAVTGSCGKTTTRRLIHAALSAKLRGSQSPKSFNNHIGVPLTLLAAGVDDDFVVAEIGTNHPGEIAQLSAIAQPDVAVITMIGRAHIGMFGSREAIAAEKGSMLQHLAAGGLAVLPDGETLLAPPAQAMCRRFTRHDDNLQLPGEHNRRNAAAAMAVAIHLGVEPAAAAAAIAALPPADMRSEVLRAGDLTILNDVYNANPDSMRAALHLLAETPIAAAGRRVAVLGDMFELGDLAESEHRALGQFVAALRPKIDLVIYVGKLSVQAAFATPHDRCVVHETWTDDLPDRVVAKLQPGDTVLVKASRGMKLERIVDAIRKHPKLSRIAP